MKARPDDAAEWLTVHIDPCLASGILVAELRGCGPTKGVAKYSHPGQVEPSSKLAERVRGVQPLQPIQYERDVGGPRSQHFVHATGLLVQRLARTELRVILRHPPHHPAVGEDDDVRAVRGIEAHDDVTATGQILGECRVIPNFGGSARS